MTRIGQILSKNVPLSDHDIEEICQEQKATRSSFGDAALALGIVRPEDVWQAWIEQIQDEHIIIDLDALGVDAQAVCYMPAETAQVYGVIPVRLHNNVLVIACRHEIDDYTRSQIASQCDKQIIIAVANAAQIEREIAHHYPSTTADSSTLASSVAAA